eukprot:397099-Prorocentrum_minimum.AAC.1
MCPNVYRRESDEGGEARGGTPLGQACLKAHLVYLHGGAILRSICMTGLSYNTGRPSLLCIPRHGALFGRRREGARGHPVGAPPVLAVGREAVVLGVVGVLLGQANQLPHPRHLLLQLQLVPEGSGGGQEGVRRGSGGGQKEGVRRGSG